jgi:C4-dicarboxylate-specific signal transduction histidine kinase
MIAIEIGYVLMQGYAIHVLGSVYCETCEYNQALDYYLQGLTIRQEAGDKWGEAGSLDNIGFTYLKLHNYEKAIDYCKRSLEITNSTSDKRGQANALLHLAEIYQQLNKIEQATKYCNDSLQIRKTTGDKRGEAETLLFLADLLKLQQANENHHILEYISAALKITEEIKAIDLSSKAQLCMHLFYKQNGDFENALKHLELHIHLEKEVHKNAVAQKVLNLEISHKAEETKKEAETIRIRNDELTKLNKEIEEQKQQLEDALNNLKNTQAQLIQSEKMASLGELTAGIAHEIQNPLNFVNNFSEINRELIEELKSQRSKLKSEELDELLDDIAANEEKINHHGKRADAIVKSMLQHSRKVQVQKNQQILIFCVMNICD